MTDSPVDRQQFHLQSKTDTITEMTSEDMSVHRATVKLAAEVEKIEDADGKAVRPPFTPEEEKKYLRKIDFW